MNDQVGTVRLIRLDGDGTWLIQLEGEHDITTLPALDEAGSVWSTCTRAIIDLGDATFIDSTVIGWLLRARAAIASNGTGHLLIVEPPDSFASRVIEITGLRGTLACYPTRCAALAAAPSESTSDSPSLELAGRRLP